MRLSLLRFYWLRVLGAVLALVLASLYLADFEEISIFGFSFMALVAAVLTIRISRNTMPASCDLCGAPATMTAEYGAGYSNARLILNCTRCGRVINSRPGSVKPQKEAAADGNRIRS